MKATVTRALSERQVKDQGDVVPFLNKELIPLAREFRAAHNQEVLTVTTLATAATGAFTTIYASDAIPTDATWRVYADVLGRVSAGAAEQASYGRVALFTNEAGVVSQVGATQTLWTIESAAGSDVRVQVSGQTFVVQVRDDGVSTYDWKALVTVLPSDEQ